MLLFVQSDNNNFKNEYPLAFFFLEQNKYFKYIKYIRQWASLFYDDNPLYKFLFNLKLYLNVQYAKIQTFYLYLSSFASFYLNTDFKHFTLYNNSIGSYWDTTENYSNNKKIKIFLLISIITILLSIFCIFIFCHTQLGFKIKIIMMRYLKQNNKKSSK